MRRFVLPESYAGGDFVELEDEDFHYLCRVRRLREGDSLPAVDRRGLSCHLTLEKVGRRSCRVRVQKKGNFPVEGPAITLYQCLPKGSKFDTIVRQAAELGVGRVVPVESRHSVPGLKDAAGRIDRWRRIAREGFQQSGAARLPEISDPIPFRNIPADRGSMDEESLGIFFHQEPLETTSLHEYLSLRRKDIALVVGPEGGLAEEETVFLRSADFVPAYLGPTVLRTETAPVFAVAAVRIILLEKEKWKLAQ